MKAIILTVGLLVSASAQAQSRPQTTAMSCASAQALVQARKSVVMSTGRDTYAQFVASESQCYLGQTALPAI